MRILMLSDRVPPDVSGGAEKVMWAVARGLKEAGHDVHTIAATHGDSFADVRDGIPVNHLHVRYPERLQHYLSIWNPQVASHLRELYERTQPDVVSAWVIHNELTYFSLWLAHRMRIPTVFNSQDVMPVSYTKLNHYVRPDRCEYARDDYRLPRWHGLRVMRTRYNPLKMPLIRHVMKNAVDVAVSGSEAHRQALAANGLDGFRVSYASVNPDDFAASDAIIAQIREQLGLQSRRVILFAGRLSRDKGSHQMLAALRILKQSVPDVLLLTLTRATLEQQGLDDPQYADLRDYVRVGGWLQGEALAAAYHAVDVVAVPSICMDTFPTINLEAMAARKPIVATCFGGSPESVQDGQTGFIVNPFDIGALADRLMHVLTDQALARRMGQAGYERLLAHFTPTRQVQEMEAAYRDAIAIRRAKGK